LYKIGKLKPIQTKYVVTYAFKIYFCLCLFRNGFHRKKLIPDYYTPVKPETYQLTSKVVMTVSFFYHDYANVD